MLQNNILFFLFHIFNNIVFNDYKNWLMNIFISSIK